MNLLFAPHSDDETLFAAFTILRFQPKVVICFPSVRDYGDTSQRLAETRRALGYLGAEEGLEQWDGYELVEKMQALPALPGAHIFAPSAVTSHPDHKAVALAAAEVYGADRVTYYHTYMDGVKIRSDRVVPFEARWVQRKLLALAQYTSQLEHPRAHQFFLNDLNEYLA